MIEHTSLFYHESTPYSPAHQYSQQLVKQEASSFYTANGYNWDENVYNFSTSPYSQLPYPSHELVHESEENAALHRPGNESIINGNLFVEQQGHFVTNGLGEVSCDDTTSSSYSCSSGHSSMAGDEVSSVKGSMAGATALCNLGVNEVTQGVTGHQSQSHMTPCDPSVILMGKGTLAVGATSDDGPPGTKVASRLTQQATAGGEGRGEKGECSELLMVSGQVVNSQQVTIKSKRNKSPGLPDSCKKCGSHFDDDRLLVRHMKVDHYYMETLQFTEPDPGDRQKRYDEWFKKQMNRASLPKELNGQYFKPFKCDICSRHYSYKGTLAGHRLKRHNLPTFIDGQLIEPSAAPSDQYLGSFICDSCGFTAGSRKLFERHVLRKHFHGMQPYPCDQCSESFDRSDRLLWHRRQKHAKQALFTCHECGRSYRTKLVFERHQRLQHSGHQFKCKECPKVFKSYASFDYHRRKHMGVDGMKFICEFCGFRFWSNQNRRKHIAKCHADHQVDSAALEENAKKDWSKEASVSVNRSSGKKTASQRSPVVTLRPVALNVVTTAPNATALTSSSSSSSSSSPSSSSSSSSPLSSSASASALTLKQDKEATDVVAQSYTVTSRNNSQSVPVTVSANGCRVGPVNDYNSRTGVSMDNKVSCRVRDDKLHHFSRSAHNSGVGCSEFTSVNTSSNGNGSEDTGLTANGEMLLTSSTSILATSCSPSKSCVSSSTTVATTTTTTSSSSTSTSTNGNNDPSPRDEASATSPSPVVHLGTSDGRELSLAACKMTHEYTRRSSPLSTASPSPSSSSCPASPCHYNMLHPASNSPMVQLNGGERGRDSCFITHPKAEMRQAHSHQSASCSSCNLPPHQPLPCNQHHNHHQQQHHQHQPSGGPVLLQINHPSNQHHHHQHNQHHNHQQQQHHQHHQHQHQPQHQPHLGHLHTGSPNSLHHHQSHHQTHICGDHGNNNNNNNSNNSTTRTQGPDNLNQMLSSTSAAPSPPSSAVTSASSSLHPPPPPLPPRCRMCFEFVYDLRVHLMNQHKVAFEALEYFLDL